MRTFKTERKSVVYDRVKCLHSTHPAPDIKEAHTANTKERNVSNFTCQQGVCCIFKVQMKLKMSFDPHPWSYCASI